MHALIAFGAEFVAGLLAERWVGVHAGAGDGSAIRYAVSCVVWTLVLCALLAVIAVELDDASLYGGWLAAFGIARLVGAARARRLERRDGVRLRVTVGSWRQRTSRYYVVSPVF